MTAGGTLLEPGCAAALWVPLPWDSSHFGFPVARLPEHARSDQLREAIEEARRQGLRLIYWEPDPAQAVPEHLLGELGGRLVAHKVTCTVTLSGADQDLSWGHPSEVQVQEYPPGSASDTLRALAVAAGTCSRFRTDPGIPPDKAITLYEIWAERSTRRELADTVLSAEVGGECVGMVTASVAQSSGTIGLLAVGEQARRKGVGRLLVSSVHAWMVQKGLTCGTVVTQLANEAACRLYQRCGYRIVGVRPCYHFWPRPGRPLASHPPLGA